MEGVQYACFDILNVYFHTSLNPVDYKHMLTLLKLSQKHTNQQYNLQKYEKEGVVYLEMRRCMYDLTQQMAPSNKLPK